MKLIAIAICCLFLILIFISFPTVISSTFTIINSVGKDCETDTGECIEVCEFEDIKLLPGTADANNTKCLAIFCGDDYTLTVHTCNQEEDPTMSCKFSHNYKKPYPDCCNQFCQSITQLD
ncbi:hypothetical protein PVAND_003146 [Polypedilum vanderplanki]|uniref:Single domain-containing protein n=1 Tax=Polypedilum vanderplanki TaxID=319348 RepID=A0A9J6BT68_POLVA|nr:hypothetical protein PVAND_003146 [Polypedilum vanderplanki]